MNSANKIRDFCWKNDCEVKFSIGMLGDLQVDITSTDATNPWKFYRVYTFELIYFAKGDILSTIICDLQDEIDKFRKEKRNDQN